MKSLLKTSTAIVRSSDPSSRASIAEGDRRANRPAVLLGGGLAAAFFFCYAGVFWMMAGQWWGNDIYSYGFLIPWVSAYLVWVRRDRLREIQPAPDFWGGIPTVIGGLSLLLAGHAGKALTLEELSLIVTLIGVVLLVLGRRFLRALLFPIVYLLFMIPIWDVITDRLHPPFQLFSSTIGLTLLQAVGVPAYRRGVFIELPNITLEVARACSGVSYLIAVVATGIPMAYLFLRGWTRRGLLVGMAVAIAVLSNGLRVALIGTLSYRGLGGDIHGPFHALQGMFVSVIGYAALFGGAWVLSPAPPSSPREGRAPVGPAQSKPVGRAFSVGAVSLSAILLLTGAYIYFDRPIPVPLKKELKNFPMEIAGWKGIDAPPSPSFLGRIGAAETLSRAYRGPSGAEAHLYVGYFGLQDEGKKLISYKTDPLFRDVSEIGLKIGDRTVRANEGILREGNSRKLILFWLDLNGKIVTNRYLARFYTMWDALAHRRTNGAIVLLSVDLPKEDGPERAGDAAERWLPAVFSELTRYLPEGR